MFHKVVLVFVLPCLLLIGACGSGSSTGSGGSSGSVNAPPGTQQDLQNNVLHIVYMFQENRSFDSYFGQLNAFRATFGLGADVDGLDKAPGTNPTRDGTGTIQSFKLKTACTEDVSPAWNESHVQRNRLTPDVSNPATMDGFVTTAAGFAITNGLTDITGSRAMGFYDQDLLPYYYFMATKFATSDRWFSPVMSKSEPNRMFGFAATSAGNTAVPTGPTPTRTIFHLLNDANISWKVYMVGPGTVMSFFQPFTADNAPHFQPISQYFADLNSGNLPSVAFIETTPGVDEHPNANVQVGAQMTSQIINAFMTSSAWASSVFILSYDEGGGVFDHVPPLAATRPDAFDPILNATELSNFGDLFTFTGFRVPLIVVSPFTKKGFVSHTPADFTAILKLIETRWDLPSLTARDAAQPSMLEYFDFVNKPWSTPPTPPVQPTSAPCNRNAPY